MLTKVNLSRFLSNNKGYKILKRCEDTTIIKLPNGELLKILDPFLVNILQNTGYSLETRLKEVDSLKKYANFAWPTRMIEDGGVVIGYTMPYIPGVDFTDYYEDTTNLKKYADLHSQIENNIKDGNKEGVIFPDLCTTENIRITPDGKVVFIDYDGLQVKHIPAIGYSDFLGGPADIETGKYFDKRTDLFTKELDIRSAISLYFVDAFGININTVNHVNPRNGKKVKVEDIFQAINLKDQDIQHKVWCLFSQNVDNEFLGDSIYKLAEENDLVYPFPGAPIKVLKPKK